MSDAFALETAFTLTQHAPMKSWIDAATAARTRAYAPYSRFPVGAALIDTGGRVHCGCNVENISFGLTMCAERVALGAAIAAGVTQFRNLVVVADTEVPVSPCGACRQVLAEFAPDLEVLLVTLKGHEWRGTLAELLPRARTGILDHP
jgi:cytidine deaminase, homotetrameric